MKYYRCLICWDVYGLAKKEKSDKNGNTRRNELITRFFQLLERHLDGGTTNKPKKEITEEVEGFLRSGMGSCDKCSEIMEGFCELFHQMKAIEQQLNWKVWSLKNSISKEDNKGEENEPNEGLKNLNKNVLKHLADFRANLANKCSKKILLTLPNLTIPKCETQTQPSFPLPVSIVKIEPSFDDDYLNELFPLPLMSPSQDFGAPPSPATSDVDYNPAMDYSPSDGALEEKISISSSKKKRGRPPSSPKPKPVVDETDPDVPYKNKSRKRTPRAKKIPRFLPDSLTGQSLKSIVKMNLQHLDYVCQICGEKFVKHRQLMHHRKRKHDGKVAGCKVCNRLFRCRTDYDIHKKTLVCRQLAKEKKAMEKSDESENIKTEAVDSLIEAKKESPVPSDIEFDYESESSNDDEGNEDLPLSKKYLRKKSDDSNDKLVTQWFQCPNCTNLFADIFSLLLHRRIACSKIDTNKPSTSAGPDELDSSKLITIKLISTKAQAAFSKTDILKGFKELVRLEVNASLELLLCPEDNCGKQFYTQADLDVHSKLHGSFSCNFCSVVESYALNLATHELIHVDKKRIEQVRPNELKSICCSRCETCFYSTSRYVEHHMSEHMSLDYLKSEFACAICSNPETPFALNFTLRSQNIKHYESHHNLKGVEDPKSIFRCKEPNCFAYFLLSRQLLKHHRQCHTTNEDKLKQIISDATRESLRCKDCGKVYCHKTSLRQHRIEKHLDKDKLFKCPHEKCALMFETEEDRTSHLRKSHVSEMKPCPKCDKAFTGLTQLQTHLRTHEKQERILAGEVVKEKNHICEQCGKAFINTARLKKHCLSHTGPETWPFCCDICGKRCLTKCSLKSHMRIHTKEKPYVCEICGNAYAQRSYLKFHKNCAHKHLIPPEEYMDTTYKPKKKKVPLEPDPAATDSSMLGSDSEDVKTEANVGDGSQGTQFFWPQFLHN